MEIKKQKIIESIIDPITYDELRSLNQELRPDGTSVVLSWKQKDKGIDKLIDEIFKQRVIIFLLLALCAGLSICVVLMHYEYFDPFDAFSASPQPSPNSLPKPPVVR